MPLSPSKTYVNGTTAIKALYSRASDCTLEFDITGAEGIDASDPGYDDPLPQDKTKPRCEPHRETILTEDTQAYNNQLDALDDDPSYDNCCGGGPGNECGTGQTTKEQAIVINGTTAISICGDTKVCIRCADLANYVAGIISTCTVSTQVGGSQELNQVDDVMQVGMTPL